MLKRLFTFKGRNRRLIFIIGLLATIGIASMACYMYSNQKEHEEHHASNLHKYTNEMLEKQQQNTASKDEEATDDRPADMNISKEDLLNGWILTYPWSKWIDEQGRFIVYYPAFLRENKEKMHKQYDCLIAEWKNLRFIAKRYRDSMPLEKKYEELKGGAVTSSIGFDSFLLAGKMYDDMRYFEKNIKGSEHWYYLRVEFPTELTAAIDPLLQYVKEYQLVEANRR